MAIDKKSPSLDDIKKNITQPVPQAIANSIRPYTVLDSRRFEELLYAIYKSELETGNLDLPFNDIALMSGTQEQGRDCGLFLNGKPVGLIQCKKYYSKISKLNCIDEILKFVLNTLIEPELINDTGDIHYYIAVASGFTNEASDFLANFSANMATYSDLKVRCEKVKKKFVTLEPIDVLKEETKIIKVLSRIKVYKITDVDLDALLNKPHNSVLLSSFFQVQAVLNEEASQALLLINEREKSGLPDKKTILDKFNEASSILRSQIKFFGQSKKHIVRNVVYELHTSLKHPFEKDSGNIIFLSAKAGMGKSVVMSDLLDQLESEGVPVLAIKADKQFGSSLIELEKNLSIPFSIVSALKRISQEYELVVLMIDQLDVLSQSFATNKEYLNAIVDLVSRLNTNEKIRVVISVRKFDLEHNQDLRFLNATKKQTKFDLNELSADEVKNVIMAMDGEPSKLSPTLLKLLQIPKNLEVFCLIYHSEIDTGTFNTEYDLYGELWRSIVIANEETTGLKLVAFLYSFASEIELEGSLSFKTARFGGQYAKEISFLLSQGILTSSKEQVQLFHQTFFDYIIARQFHEKSRSLHDFILQHKNEINIRSTVRAVMYYSSQVSSPETYLHNTRKVLMSADITYNIKTLLIESIARDLPNVQKIHDAIKQDMILMDRFSQVFFENLDNAALIEQAIENRWLDIFLSTRPNRIQEKIFKYLKKFDALRIWFAKRGMESFNYNIRLNIVYRLLYNKINYHPKAAIEWLSATNSIENKERFTFQLLYTFKRWDTTHSLELLKSVIPSFRKDHFGVFTILENIAANYPQEAFQIYRDQIFSINDFKRDSFQYPRLEYHENKFLDLIGSQAPFDFLDFFLSLIGELSANVELTPELEHKYISEGNLLFYSYTDPDKEDGELLTCLINAGKFCAVNSSSLFVKIFEKYKNSKSASILTVLIMGLKENINLVVHSHELIRIVYQKTLFDFDGNASWYFRRLLQQTFPIISESEQIEILSWILQIQPEHDKVFEWNGKKYYPKWSGETKLKFLQAIPFDKLSLIPDAKKEFGELERKFSNTADDMPRGIQVFSVKPPLSKQAYEKMSLENWKESFLKYNSNAERNFGSSKGGLTEHARAFTDEVAKNPEFFFNFIITLSDQKNISIEYSIAGLDGLIKGAYSPEKVSSLFLKLLPLVSERYEIMRLVWHSDYLIRSNVISEKLIEFLIIQAKTNTDPVFDSSDSSPIQRGINSVRGAAADRLMSMAWDTQYYQKLIPIIEDLLNDPSPAVRATILSKLQYLLRSDREKVYTLFLRLLTHNPHPEFWTISVQTAQYLVYGHFEKMQWYFQSMLETEELSKSAIQILANYHIHEKTNCRPIMEQFFKKFPSTIPTLILFLDSTLVSKDRTKNLMSIELYWSFIHHKDLKIADAYNTNMLHLKPDHFEFHLEYLGKFSKSYCGKHSYYYLWNYLLKNVAHYPFQCLEIVSNYTIADLDNLERDYIDESLVRLVMAIYTQLHKSIEHDMVNKKINTILDRILLSEKYRSAVTRALVLSEE